MWLFKKKKPKVEEKEVVYISIIKSLVVENNVNGKLYRFISKNNCGLKFVVSQTSPLFKVRQLTNLDKTEDYKYYDLASFTGHSVIEIEWTKVGALRDSHGRLEAIA